MSASDPSPRPSSASTTPSTDKTYATFSQPAPPPPPSANLLSPSSSTTTSSSTDALPTRPATVVDALTTISLSDFANIHQRPCVRDALLTGIAGGFCLGGVRMVWGATAWRAMSWAIGTFCVGSAGMYEFCHRRRILERRGMDKAREIVERKRAQRLEEMRRERERRKLEKER